MKFQLQLPSIAFGVLIFAQLILLAFLAAGYIPVLVGILPIIAVGSIWFLGALVWTIKQML